EEVAGGVPHRVDDRVVAQVRPAVVHVQDGDFYGALVRRRQVLGPLHAHVVVDRRAEGRAPLEAVPLAVFALELAGIAPRAQEELQGMRGRCSHPVPVYRPRRVSSTRKSTTARRSCEASHTATCRSAPVSPSRAQVRRNAISSRVPRSSTTSSTKSSTSPMSWRVGASPRRWKSIISPSSPRLRARNVFSMITARSYTRM